MSESPVIKLRKRLSLKHYASDSPKTPKNNKNKNVYSTPINRKRCAFDESPSQDAFSSPLTFSQDVSNRVETDVTWEWNSPKRQNITEKRKPKTKLCLLGRKTPKEKTIKKSEVNGGEKGGFFKFEEELKNIKLSNSSVSDSKASDLIIDKANNSNEENLTGNYSNFFNDSDFDSIIMQCNVEPIPIKDNSNVAGSSFTRFTSLPTNNVSVQVDKTQYFQRTVTLPTVLDKSASGSSLTFTGNPNYVPPNELKESEISYNEFFKDSEEFDDVISEVISPSTSDAKKSENSYNAFFDDSEDFDDILMQCSQKVEEEMKQFSQNSVPDLNKKSFTRHYSMPGSPNINKKINKEVVVKPSTQNKNFPRTISMPIRGGQFKISPTSSFSCSSNSSTNSLVRCTFKEVQEKKQRALRKLQEKKKLEK